MLICNSACKTENKPIDTYQHKMKIMEVLNEQQEAWDRGDVSEYMKGYHNSDSLMFIGSSGVNYGFQKVLENYQKSYPNKVAMGDLSFEVLKLHLLDTNYAHMVGTWALKRDSDDLSGHFTLLWKNFQGEWKIIRDHSS